MKAKSIKALWATVTVLGLAPVLSIPFGDVDKLEVFKEGPKDGEVFTWVAKYDLGNSKLDVTIRDIRLE